MTHVEDYEARVAFIANAIEIEPLNLDNTTRLVRALLDMRLCAEDFVDVMDDAIEVVRKRKGTLR